MSAIRSTSTTLKGLSFSIADLVLVMAWAEARSLNMVVQLDFGTEVEVYEEVLEFHTERNASCHWIMWRDTETVWVQPLIGRPQPYDSVADAIESVGARQPFVQSDISTTPWKSAS
jgi:hypothetical protein